MDAELLSVGFKPQTLPQNLEGGYQDILALKEIELKKAKAAEKTAAMAMYYTDKLLKPATPPQEKASIKSALSATCAAEQKKGFFRKVSDWFSGIFGIKKSEDLTSNEASKVDESEENDTPAILTFIPQLEDAIKSDKKLRDSYKQLNDEIKRLTEDSIEFEKQLLANPAMQGKLLIEMGLKQRDQKAQVSLFLHDIIQDAHKENKKLHNTHFSLKDEIEKHEKTCKTARWINVGQTVIAIGVLAGAFATGGGIIVAAVGAVAGLSAGGLKVTEGINKHKGEKKTGELGGVTLMRKMNSSRISDGVLAMGDIDKESARLMTMLIKHEKNKQDAIKPFIRM